MSISEYYFISYVYYFKIHSTQCSYRSTNTLSHGGGGGGGVVINSYFFKTPYSLNMEIHKSVYDRIIFAFISLWRKDRKQSGF